MSLKNFLFFYLILLKLFLIGSNEFPKKIIVIPFKSYLPNINQSDELIKYLGSIIKRKIYW